MGAVYERLDDAALLPRLAEVLAERTWSAGSRGAWSSGRAPWVGAPSSATRAAKMQSVMNLKIKYRESFRPFAPSVLAEHVSEYFETGPPSPYMLLVAPVKGSRDRHDGASSSSCSASKAQRAALRDPGDHPCRLFGAGADGA